MKKLIGFVLISFVICSLCGCSSDEVVNFPDCGLPADRMNTYIEIEYDDIANSYRLGDAVEARVFPKKSFKYFAESDYSIKIFILDGETKSWSNIENAVIDVNPPVTIYSEGEIGFLFFYPKVNDSTQSVHLFYCIYGNIVENDVITDEQIGASSEIILAPAENLN